MTMAFQYPSFGDIRQHPELDGKPRLRPDSAACNGSGSPCSQTFRATNRKYGYHYRKEHVMLIRKVVTRPPSYERESQSASRSDLEYSDTISMRDETFAFNVFYSMNKRERWNLPLLIEDELSQHGCGPVILQEINVDSYDKITSIEFVERVKLYKNSNATFVGSWDPESLDPDTLAYDCFWKSSISCQPDNMLQTQPLFSRRTRRHLALRENPNDWDLRRKSSKDDDEADGQRVRIDVMVSEDYSSVRKVKPKHIGIDTRKYFICGNYIRRPYLHTGYRFRRGFMKERQRMYKDVHSCGVDDNFDGPLTDSEENLEVWDRDQEQKQPERQQVTLYDFVKIRLKETTTAKSEKNMSNGNYINKAHSETPLHQRTVDVSTENKSPNTNISDNHTQCQESDNTCKPSFSFNSKENRDVSNYRNNVRSTRVTLSKDSTRPEQLSMEYGERYIECHCVPRRFLIDISEDIAKACADETRNIKDLRAFGWLVFEEDEYVTSVNTQRYNVSLNIKHSLEESNAIEQLGEIEINSETSLNKVLDLVLEYVKRHIELFDIQDCSDHGHLRENLPRSCLHQTAHWVFKSYKPTLSFLLEILFSSLIRGSRRQGLRSRESDRQFRRHSSHSNRQNNPLKTVETVSTCDICLLIMEYTTGPTKLIACGHTFCNRCWVTYLENVTKYSLGQLTCPQFNCSEKVDIGTLLSFVNVTDCLRYASVQHDREVDSDRHRRWCRNGRCGRVLVRSSIDVAEVQCPCGDVCCFDCSAKPHWPLSCEGYVDYSMSVLDRGKVVSPPNFIVKFDCRICRLCYGQVRRYDRCEISKCLCSSKMCLTCSVFWHRRHGRYDDNLKISHEQTSINFKILAGDLDLFSVEKLHKWTSFVTQHRIQQHPYRIQKIFSLVKPISQKIKSHFIREGIQAGLCLDFDVNGQNYSYVNEAAKVEPFIEYFVSMYGELNRVLEHAGVMLDVDQVGSHKAELQHYVLKLANNSKLLLVLFREANIQRPVRLLATFKEIRISSEHLLYCLVQKVKAMNRR